MTTGKPGMRTVIPLKGRVGQNLRERKNALGYVAKKAALGRFGNEISEYLSTALKGWDVWVNNKAREHIILQDDA